MESKTNNPLECCLYFTANSLARNITRMGEEEFAVLGMTPSYLSADAGNYIPRYFSKGTLRGDEHGALYCFTFY